MSVLFIEFCSQNCLISMELYQNRVSAFFPRRMLFYHLPSKFCVAVEWGETGNWDVLGLMARVLGSDEQLLITVLCFRNGELT